MEANGASFSVAENDADCERKALAWTAENGGVTSVFSFAAKLCLVFMIDWETVASILGRPALRGPCVHHEVLNGCSDATHGVGW